MKNKIALVFLLSFSLIGCATSGNQALKSETETSVSTKIIEGKSTKSDVKAYFGSPDNVSFTDGGKEIWKYGFANIKMDGTTFIPFYGLFHNGMHGTKKELTILFNDNIVEKYTMSESPVVTKSGWAD